MWRSSVAYLLWEQGAAGSNPAIPTVADLLFVYAGVLKCAHKQAAVQYLIITFECVMEEKTRNAYESVLKLVIFAFLVVLFLAVYGAYLMFMNDSAFGPDQKSRVQELRAENIRLATRLKKCEGKMARRDPETIWLARALYSETDHPLEMHYVAWVIRNRIELEYNGASTYREAILAPYQFSAFNTAERRAELLTLDAGTKGNLLWSFALQVAIDVRQADDEERLLPQNTTHFYSQISMPKDKPHPDWRWHMSQVHVSEVSSYRFRFFQSTRS